MDRLTFGAETDLCREVYEAAEVASPVSWAAMGPHANFLLAN